MNRNTVYMILRLLAVAVIAWLGLRLFLYVSALVYPFLIAFVIAYAINPIVDLLDNKLRFPRALAVFITLVLSFGAVVGLVILLVTEAIAASNYLLEVVPQRFPEIAAYVESFIVNNIIPLYTDLNARFNTLAESQQDTITLNIQNLGTDLTQKAKDILTAILTGLTGFLGALPNVVTVLIFILLATFFISNGWYRIADGMKRLLPERFHGYGRTIFDDLRKALLGFVKAQFTLISITTVIVLIGLLILRVPYAITIALVTGIVDLLPYLGTGAVFVPWIVYVYFTGNIPLAIGLLVLYIVIIVQRQIMEPKVLSSNIGLDPLATLISLFVGFQLFGFLGLIIGPAVLVLLKTLHDANVFRDLWKFVVGK